ncbi:MAG TPA: UbiA family prenyltransferase [Terracidiphilus sp.]|nr:UbiA family prenyltransferase [Terracidiphilus sp.]
MRSEMPLPVAAELAETLELARPLCVDLDGTLVKSDTLLEEFCQLARKQPWLLLRVPIWLSRGKANLKIEVGRRAPLDPLQLPYNLDLLGYLRALRREGQPIFLTTGADGATAERVAAHLGLFEDVLASDGETNLINGHKLNRIQARFAEFDYIGNSRADLALLANARQAMVANPTRILRLSLRLRGISVARTFNDRRPAARTLLKAVRVHQWAKNILLLAPLAFSHRITRGSLAAAIAAFFCFSFMASANYLINDMLDIESDRRHPAKRLRPFAAGDFSIASGLALAAGLFVASAAMLPMLSRNFAMWLGVYIVSTMAYSMVLKRHAVVDVLLLSGLYTLRLLAGGAATDTEISPWLAGFSTFLFLSLAMVKRFSELENLRERGGAIPHGRGYRVSDMGQIRSFGTASAYAAVVVFMLYIARPDVTALYSHPTRLWLVVPLLLYWLNRVWLLASRGQLDDDPVVFAVRDRVSLAIGIGVVAVGIFAA